MAAIDWDFLIAWLLVPGFGLLTALYLHQRLSRRLTRIDWPYLAYLFLGLLWGLGVLFAHPRIRDLSFLIPFERLAPYLVAISPSLLLLTTAELIRAGRPRWRWLLIAPAILLVIAALHDASLRPSLTKILVLGARRFDRDGLWRLMLVTANLASAIATFRLTIELHRLDWGLVYRNRLRYWFLSLCLLVVGDLLALIFSPPELLLYVGGLARLGGATMTTATLLIPFLPTTNFLARRFLQILLLGLILFGLSLTGIFSAQTVLADNEQGAILVGAAFAAAFAALIYNPLQRRVQAVIDGLILGRQTDLRNVLVEYTQQISQQLDLKELADTVISLLSGALHLAEDGQSGALVLVQITDQGAVGLSPIDRPNAPSLPDLLCDPESPLAAYWRENEGALSQSDIEVLPDFADVPEYEQKRLNQWSAELYVPLRTSEKLVGLLALGPKRDKTAYSPAEVRFLKSLAGRTAVAMEQAQLLSDLKIANTQLTRLSDELAQVNRRLYEADRLKTGFISIITHELRSPFVALALSFQLIERHGLEHLLPEQREQLQEMQEGVTELKQMVDHIIAFASLLSKQGELKMERVDLSTTVDQTIAAIRPMAESRQIVLDARVWPGLPPILGDRERLSEAIYHLIHNAIKFNESGGWVRIRCQPDNGNIEIRVQDNGVGIPSDRLEHLWNAFAQMADPLRRGVEGLGLGLALVRYVAVAHGGEVWAESVEGEGSTFGFKIPAMHEEDARRPKMLQ